MIKKNTDYDKEEKLNSLELEFLKEAAMFIQAFTSSIPNPPPTPHNLVDRDCYGVYVRLVAANFSENPMYDDDTLCKRFQMSRTLYTRIVRELTDNFPYFQQTIDCTRKVDVPY